MTYGQRSQTDAVEDLNRTDEKITEHLIGREISDSAESVTSAHAQGAESSWKHMI
jgi:hypothetical protein